MKTSRRMLAVVVCMVMVLSMAVVASAAASKLFFNKSSGGYQCTGRGTIDGNVATATFSATEIPLKPVIPSEACTSTIYVLAYDTAGNYMGAATSDGNVNAYAYYRANLNVGESYCSFEFNGADLGSYILANN